MSCDLDPIIFLGVNGNRRRRWRKQNEKKSRRRRQAAAVLCVPRYRKSKRVTRRQARDEL